MLLNAGLTGVERGAYLGAETFGVAIAGIMRANGRDELGPVPPVLAARLVRCAQKGPRRAREANVREASVVVVAVPDASHAARFTGMKQVLMAARMARVPTFTCDATTRLDDLATAVMRAPSTHAPRRIYIAGPRATRWADGEALGRSIACAIAIAATRMFGDADRIPI